LNHPADTQQWHLDIKPEEELFAFYSSDYFDDVEGGCPCQSCQHEAYTQCDADKQERQRDMQHQAEKDQIIIKEKRKEQKQRRRAKQKTKAKES